MSALRIRRPLMDLLRLWVFIACLGGAALAQASFGGGASTESAPPGHSIYLPLVYRAQGVGVAPVTPAHGGEAGYPPAQIHVRIPAGAVAGPSTLRIGPAGVSAPAGVSDLSLLAEVELRDAAGQPITTLGQPRHDSVQLRERGSEPDRRREPGHLHPGHDRGLGPAIHDAGCRRSHGQRHRQPFLPLRSLWRSPCG
jgi:hypothetical protein